MRFTLVTKGNREFGLGHVYRMLTLAKELLELSNDSQVNFVLTNDSSDLAFHKIQKEGFEVMRVSNIKEIPKIIVLCLPEMIIFDMLNIPAIIARSIKRSLPNSKLILFDNNTKANIYADHVVNALTLSYNDMKYYDSLHKTMYFFGPRFLLLGREFCEAKSKQKNIVNLQQNSFRIMISFGGSDPNNLTTLVLTSLFEHPNLYENISKLLVVLGPQFKNWEMVLNTIEKLQNVVGIDVDIYKDTDNMANLMSQSDIVITSPGLTMFEAWFLEKPTLLLFQNNLQKRFYKKFLNLLSTKNNLKFMDNLIYVDPKKEKVKRLYIGYGKWEVLEAVTNAYTVTTLPSGDTLALRQATENDLEVMMAWRSHPQIYKYFYLQDTPLKWHEHYNWWKSRTNRVDWIIVLIDSDNSTIQRMVGSINVSKLDTKNPEIGIYIGEITMWGRGLARTSILLVLRWLKSMGYKRACARVMSENARSIKLFTSLGFKLKGESRPGEYLYEVNLKGVF